MEHRLHKHVAAFLFHRRNVLLVDCVNEFVGFFDEVYANTLVRLRPIPLATVVGAKSVHNLFQIRKIESLAIDERYGRRDYHVLVALYFGHANRFVLAVLFYGEFDIAVYVQKFCLDIFGVFCVDTVNHERYALVEKNRRQKICGYVTLIRAFENVIEFHCCTPKILLSYATPTAVF